MLGFILYNERITEKNHQTFWYRIFFMDRITKTYFFAVLPEGAVNTFSTMTSSFSLYIYIVSRIFDEKQEFLSWNEKPTLEYFNFRNDAERCGDDKARKIVINFCWFIVPTSGAAKYIQNLEFSRIAKLTFLKTL